MKLFEKPWLEILEIKVNDIVTESEGIADDVTDENGGEYGED